MSAILASLGVRGEAPRRFILAAKNNPKKQAAAKSTDAGTRGEGEADMSRADVCVTCRQAQGQARARSREDGRLVG